MAYNTNKAPVRQNPFEGVLPARVEFTIGTENTNAINVSLQLQSGGQDLYAMAAVNAYLSDNSDGSTLAASAPSGGWAIGTSGLLIPVVTNKAAMFISESNGVVDVTITESTAKTFYMVVILPDGTINVSDAITFA